MESIPLNEFKKNLYYELDDVMNNNQVKEIIMPTYDDLDNGVVLVPKKIWHRCYMSDDE